MVRLLVVEPVAVPRATGALQIRRVAVEELRALERILAQEPVGAAVDELDGVVALELAERPRVAVDADVVQRRRLAPHDRTPTEMGLDVDVMRGHHRDDGLTQPRGRLRPKVAHPRRAHHLYGSRNIATRRYDVKDDSTQPPSVFWPN